jgi:hypothetical protein
MPTKDLGASDDYACDDFREAFLLFILGYVNMRIAADPQNIAPEERIEIKQRIEDAVASDKSHPYRLTEVTLSTVINAYIRLFRVYSLAVYSQDCTGFADALRSVYFSLL